MKEMKHHWTATIIILCAGCTVGPDFVRPEGPGIKQYAKEEFSETKQAGGVAQRFEADAKVPQNWWRLFNESKLDSVITAALSKNYTVQAALANLRQSQQNLAAGEGIYYPQVNANFGVSRQRTNPASLGVSAPPSIFNLFTLSSAITYALDVFGAKRRAVEGLRAQEDLSHSIVLATYLTLTGNLVNGVIARAAYEAEVEATQELIGSLKEQVAITETNVKSGTVAYVSLLSLRSQLAATQATLPPLSQRLSQTNHMLAILSGQMPAEWTPPELRLVDLNLPAALPKSLPSELVRQRPDILQSEAELHVASAQIGIATAALFPSFTLTGAIGLNNASAGKLLSSDKSEFWNFGADITAPLFHGGTLRAERQAAVEAFQAALATYRQTVLVAVQQVADTLRALENDAEQVRAQSEALAAADESQKLIAANYAAGTAGYLQLLTANAQLFQSKIGYLQAIAQRYQDTVALFVALGGGWWNARQGARRF